MVRTDIWRDTYYTTSADTLTYYIMMNGSQVIFAGKAYRAPNDDEIKIKVNAICRNYLSNDIGPLIDAYIENRTPLSAAADNALVEFELYDDNDTLLETYEFLYNWSYDVGNPWNGSVYWSGKPVNGRVVNNMLRLNTVLSGNEIRNILFDNTEYEIIDKCNAEYAIYYLSSYGSWFSFLFEGKCTKKDTMTQYTTDRAFNNLSREFETSRYVSEINTSYTLSTGWLNDEQSANFAKNVVSSNIVYLHDLKTGTVVPALITDSSVVYQNMKNNNGKMSCYQLNIKESQNKLRG